MHVTRSSDGCEGAYKGEAVVFKNKSFCSSPLPQHRLKLSNTDRPSADRQPALNLHVESSVRLSKTPADGDQLRLTSYKCLQLLLSWHFVADSRQFKPWVIQCWRTGRATVSFLLPPIKLKAGHFGPHVNWKWSVYQTLGLHLTQSF